MAVDPAWVLPRLMKAGFLLSLTEASLVAAARAELDAAEPTMAHATRRERDHLGALRRLAAGDWPGACGAWEGLLLQHPRDALALQWAHLFDFYRGDALNLRQRIARVLPEWDEADPLWPHVLALHAFGLEESRLYDEAEAAGRRALAASPQVPWAMHAVAHVMEMQGRHVEGAQWLSQWEAHWAVGNGFSGHLGWHHGLFALEALDHARALQRFDTYLRTSPEQITLLRLDAAALLWRMQLLAIDVGPRWQQLVGGWDLSAAAAGQSAFNDLHGLLALLGSGDGQAGETWVRHCIERADAGSGSNRDVMREVGAPLLRGLLAFGRGRYGDAIEALYPARDHTRRIGGSHAQRELIDQTLLAAAARSGHVAVGRALLNERRLARANTPLTDHWAHALGLRPNMN
jgi:tetratricopeptide (TPR) repeat protein